VWRKASNRSEDEEEEISSSGRILSEEAMEGCVTDERCSDYYWAIVARDSAPDPTV